jgi:hypothetical protein
MEMGAPYFNLNFSDLYELKGGGTDKKSRFISSITSIDSRGYLWLLVFITPSKKHSLHLPAFQPLFRLESQLGRSQVAIY